MDYISVKAASEKQNILERRVQELCKGNRVDGTEELGRVWMAPENAGKPADGYTKVRSEQKENHEI